MYSILQISAGITLLDRSYSNIARVEVHRADAVFTTELHFSSSIFAYWQCIVLTDNQM